MELENSSNDASLPVAENCSFGAAHVRPEDPSYDDADGFTDEIDSKCSTPYVSAPSSPGRFPPVGGYFFSAPTSPMHYVLSTPPYSVSSSPIQSDASFTGSADFEFSAKYACLTSTADELFLNGQIRPMKLSSHLQRPQILAPLLDVDEEENAKEGGDSVERGRDTRMRSRSIHRRARSMSPSRNTRFRWQIEGDEGEKIDDVKEEEADPVKGSEALTPSVSASSSRSSSSGRNSKRWVFLKELLYRSKSEGRANAKEKFWHSISFSPSKDKSKLPPTIPPLSSANTTSESSQKQSRKSGSSSDSSKRSGSSAKTATSGGKRRWPAPSPHERLYTANRAQTEEMRKRTFLPYRQGLFGCLGFNSRSYGAISSFAKTLNPVPSR